MHARLQLVVLLFVAATVSASGEPLACTNVTSGYLAFKISSYDYTTIQAIASTPALDAGGHPYLHGNHSAPLQLFTLQSCNSSFLGFRNNDTTVFGRWRSEGACVAAEKSDGALVLKPCAATDGSALLRQYFSLSAGTTQLVGGTAMNNTMMYTYESGHHGLNIPTQQLAKPPGWSYHRPYYRRSLVYYALPSKPPAKWFS